MVQAPETGPGHLYEGVHGALGAQGRFYGPEEIVRLEDQNHLTIDVGQ